MIVVPTTDEEHQTIAAFMMHYAGVEYTPNSRAVGWVSEDRLWIAVILTGFMGKVCQIHIAMDPSYHYAPKEMLKVVFKYAFNDAGRDVLIGVVNSNNEKALKFDLHLGFKEVYRIAGAHDDGGDVVVLQMNKADCKYLKE